MYRNIKKVWTRCSFIPRNPRRNMSDECHDSINALRTIGVNFVGIDFDVSVVLSRSLTNCVDVSFFFLSSANVYIKTYGWALAGISGGASGGNQRRVPEAGPRPH
jgi:hypothetical protein